MIGCAVEFTIPHNGRYRGLCFDVRHDRAYVVVLGHSHVYDCDPASLLIVHHTFSAPHHRPQVNGIPTPVDDHTPVGLAAIQPIRT